MAKLKQKKNLSEKIAKKKKEGAKKVNPFEVKVNRQKHDVLGRKVAKHVRGMPGVSRSKATKKRKETLLVEHQRKHKVNTFVDRRIGENNPELSVEDKMVQRFAAERQRHHDKGSMYNLNEEEELTHFGQSLAEIEKFDDPVISDDEDDIDAKIIGQEHFGGFLSRKTEDEKTETKHKTWKERMEEMIAQSKKEKHERQHEREKNMELTAKLDSDWKELGHLLGSIKGKKSKEDDKDEIDDFDKTVRELKFESKGNPTDRMKTDEEMAKEENERLEKLEEDRLRRMKGLSETEEAQHKAAYRSADDLDDGLSLGKGPKYEVSYKDGRLVGGEEGEEGESDAEGEEEEAGSSDEEGEEEEGEEEEEREDEEEGEEDEDDGSESSDAMEHTSDLESDAESDPEEEKEGKDEEEKGRKGRVEGDEEKKAPAKKKVSFSETLTVGPKDVKKLLEGRKKSMEAAKKELPYTFKAPETYIDLLNIFGDHSEDDQIIIIERIRKCTHPSLAEGNKAKLECLFGLLVEYFGDLALQEPPCLYLMNRLVKPIYELCQSSPLPAGLYCVSLLTDRQSQFTEYAQIHGGRGLYPTLDMLLQLKLLAQLFPSSDFHHHVVTPAMMFMSQMLTQCPVTTRRDIASGLFISSLFLEFTSFSKRFVPEVINFLTGLLFLAIEKDPKKIEPVIPPFKPVGRNINFLELQKPEEASSIEVSSFNLTDVFSRKKAQFLSTDKFRLCAVSQCVKLLQAFSHLYLDLPSYHDVFTPVKYFLEKLPSQSYPQSLKDSIKDLLETIAKKDEEPWKSLVMPKLRPKPMKMFEPKFDENFDGRKKRGVNREFAEKQRTLHKYKKEMKGAMREIRKDTQFLAKQKLEAKLSLDAERKRKVKEIYGQLANQEGDYKKLKREKDRL